MSMLAFLPWFSIESRLEVAEFELVPYERGTKPGGSGTELQGIIDQVLAPYRFEDEPVRTATIVGCHGGELAQDLSAEDRSRTMVLSQVLATSALAGREYFGSLSMRYQNSDYFRLIIQEFTVPFQGITIISRRRDGPNMNFMPKDSYMCQRPDHVFPFAKDCLDRPLVHSLLRARDLSDWNQLYEAMLWFNMANSDNIEVPEYTEVVFLSSAFERLLDRQQGKEAALAEGFTRLVSPRVAVPMDKPKHIDPKEISRRFKRSSTIRDVWIRDFFRLRGGIAHGTIESRYKSLWSLKTHLLLGSYVFPLALKLELRRMGIYELTERDTDAVDVFERLACEEHFPECDSSDSDDPQPWDRVVEQFERERRREKLADALRRAGETT